jgi:hypothetical protein
MSIEKILKERWRLVASNNSFLLQRMSPEMAHRASCYDRFCAAAGGIADFGLVRKNCLKLKELLLRGLRLKRNSQTHYPFLYGFGRATGSLGDFFQWFRSAGELHQSTVVRERPVPFDHRQNLLFRTKSPSGACVRSSASP